MSTLFKVIYRFNSISVKIPITFFLQKLKNTILKSKWNLKGSQIAKIIFKKKMLEYSHFRCQTFYKVTLVNTVFVA